MDHASETPALGRNAGLARCDTPWVRLGRRSGPGSSATTSGSLVAALEAVAPACPANEQWADPNEVLRQRTLVSGLLQRGAEVSAVARAGEFWAEAGEKDVIRNGRTRRRRLVQPGVI